MGRPRKVKSVSLACAEALRGVPTETLPSDAAPTPERLMQAGVTVAMQLGTRRVQIIGRGGGAVVGFDQVVRIAQAPLDRLHARDRLDETDPERNRQLYEAGNKLRDHHYMAGLSGFAANDPNGGGGGHPASRTPITETMERNRRALRIAESAMDAGDWRIVADVICDELGLAEAGRKVGYGSDDAASAVALDRLRRGLGALAELWGYSPPRRPEAGSAANDVAASASAA